METVVLVIHLLLVAAMIAVILVQRSEGGALGIGGGANFMASRGTGNMLTRATTILAAGFFITSIGLTMLARSSTTPATSSTTSRSMNCRPTLPASRRLVPTAL